MDGVPSTRRILSGGGKSTQHGDKLEHGASWSMEESDGRRQSWRGEEQGRETTEGKTQDCSSYHRQADTVCESSVDWGLLTFSTKTLTRSARHSCHGRLSRTSP